MGLKYRTVSPLRLNAAIINAQEAAGLAAEPSGGEPVGMPTEMPFAAEPVGEAPASSEVSPDEPADTAADEIIVVE